MFSPSILGGNLRALRALQGLTQEDMKKRSRVSRAWLSRVESGKNTPSIATLEKLSRALGVSMHIALGGEALYASLPADPFLRQVAGLVGKLTGQQMDLILRTLMRMQQAA